MKLRSQFGAWFGGLGLSAMLGIVLMLAAPFVGTVAARQRPKDRAVRPPAAAERKAERRNDRPPVNPNNAGSGTGFNSGANRVNPNVNPNRPPGARNRLNPQERLRNMTP